LLVLLIEIFFAKIIGDESGEEEEEEEE